MEGIAPNDRVELVLKHHACLMHAGSPSPAKLGELMENIVWKQYFVQPLKLLFLTAMIHSKLDTVKDNTTQINVY